MATVHTSESALASCRMSTTMYKEYKHVLEWDRVLHVAKVFLSGVSGYIASCYYRNAILQLQLPWKYFCVYVRLFLFWLACAEKLPGTVLKERLHRWQKLDDSLLGFFLALLSTCSFLWCRTTHFTDSTSWLFSTLSFGPTRRTRESWQLTQPTVKFR